MSHDNIIILTVYLFLCQMHQENDPTYPKFFERTPICQGVGFGEFGLMCYEVLGRQELN